MGDFESIDRKRRDLLLKLEELRHQRNKVSQEIAEMKRAGKDAAGQISEMKEVSEQIKKMETTLSSIEEAFKPLLMLIPNMPHESVPVGADETDNPVVRHWGNIAGKDFEPRSHWEIGEQLGILDFACAAKLAGARFALYRGAGAKLERALINFMLDIHTAEHGYVEVLPPFMVNVVSECIPSSPDEISNVPPFISILLFE